MIYYFYVILGIFACSLSQLMLKKSANQSHKSKIAEFINPWVITAYIFLGGSLLVNIWAMSRGLQLKEIATLETLGYLFVPLLSFFIQKEKISMRSCVGIGIIIIGMVIFYL